MFPLKNYKYEIPTNPSIEPGAFGAVRKLDIHTGVDLYCENGDYVYAIEDGEVTAVIPFTGEHAESPWWENTFAILIYNAENDRTILYGEVTTQPRLFSGNFITKESNSIIGFVKRVLKKDKGIVPSTSMLHMEVYQGKVTDAVWWKLGEPKPESLQDVTYI